MFHDKHSTYQELDMAGYHKNYFSAAYDVGRPKPSFPNHMARIECLNFTPLFGSTSNL